MNKLFTIPLQVRVTIFIKRLSGIPILREYFYLLVSHNGIITSFCVSYCHIKLIPWIYYCILSTTSMHYKFIPWNKFESEFYLNDV